MSTNFGIFSALIYRLANILQGSASDAIRIQKSVL